MQEDCHLSEDAWYRNAHIGSQDQKSATMWIEES